jgi:YaiO family outer membrane protein
MKRLLLVILVAVPLFAQQVRELSAGVELEDLPGDSWKQAHVALRLGPVIGRVAHAERGAAEDEQFEVEAYPRFAKKTYAYLAGALAADGTLYPDWRVGAELYHGFGNAFEASAGWRHLAFDDEVDLYTASLGKYVGNWLFIGRVYRTTDNNSWQATARRYFGDGGSYLGARAGTARDEIRSGADVRALQRNEAVLEGLYVAPSRWTVQGRAGGTSDGIVAALAVGRRF